jgi:hypothetical protein
MGKEPARLGSGNREAIRQGRSLKSTAFDLSSWHSGPSCVRSFVPGYGGILVKVCCAPCGMLCDVEATGSRCTVEESYKMRQAVKR